MILGNYSTIQILSLLISAVLVGMRPAGIQAAAIAAVAILAAVFEPAVSVGMTVVFFLTADIQAVFLYYKDTDWTLLIKLLLPTIVGIAVAAFIGPLIPVEIFEWVLLFIILIGFIGMLYQRHHAIDFADSSAIVPLTLIFGFLTGFTSMIGNLSGIFVTIFFSVVRANKVQFVATTALFFFIINLIKLPVHLFIWHSLSGATTITTLVFIPVVAVGIFLGRVIVRSMSEETFWKFVIIMSLAGIIRFMVSMFCGV